MSPSGGGYLLSHFRSTIGVVRLNFSVRNGKRWDPHAITTLMTSAMNNERLIIDAVMIRDRLTGNATVTSHCPRCSLPCPEPSLI